MSDRETREAEARVDAAADRYEREHVMPESFRRLPASTTQITINRLQAETRKMRAQLARVRALHQRVEVRGGALDYCEECGDETTWPCATVRAINLDAGREVI